MGQKKYNDTRLRIKQSCSVGIIDHCITGITFDLHFTVLNCEYCLIWMIYNTVANAIGEEEASWNKPVCGGVQW